MAPVSTVDLAGSEDPAAARTSLWTRAARIGLRCSALHGGDALVGTAVAP